MSSLFSLLLAVFACLFLWVTPAVAQDISTEVATGLEAQILNLSFDDLPAFERDGFVLGYRDSIFQAEGQDGLDRFDAAAEAAGFPIPLYDPAREWLAGQFPSEVIKIGDLLNTGMGIEQLTMDSIAELTGIDIEHFQLADVPFLRDVTLHDLVGSVPFLGDYRLAELPDLAQQLGALNSEETLSQLLLENSPLGELLVVGDVLGELQVADLPNLGITHLGDLPKIGDDMVANVPGLSVLQFGSFPGLELASGLVPLAKQDIAFENKEYSGEQATPNPVSGGTDGGKAWKAIPCKEGCAHIELYDADVLPVKGAWAGANWMTRAHRVKDGYGLLGALFGEAGAYRLPFGQTFALQVRGTDEKTGAAEWGLAFRVCSKGLFFDLGCTAYFLEVDLPITTHEGATILTGIKDGKGGVTEPVAAPEGWEGLKPATPPELRNAVGTNTSGGHRSRYGLCGKGPHGVDFEALGNAYESIESKGAGGYNAIGIQVGEGRALGRYQYMSYRTDVRDVFKSRGGMHVIERLDSGGNITQEELQKYFPPEEQNIVFRNDQEYLIERAASQGFAGSRLIERVGQMHFGGPTAPVDFGSSDGLGVLSGKAYGEKLSNSYDQETRSERGTCGKSSGKLTNPVPDGYVVTSGFGWRVHPVSGDQKFHSGIDLAADKGTAIVAADGGIVVHAGHGGGYGNLVEIEHEDGSKTWYGHLDSIGVNVGDPIAQGDQLGTMGSTGISTGDHLDFGVISPDGTILDPASIVNF